MNMNLIWIAARVAAGGPVAGSPVSVTDLSWEDADWTDPATWSPSSAPAVAAEIQRRIEAAEAADQAGGERGKGVYADANNGYVIFLRKGDRFFAVHDQIAIHGRDDAHAPFELAEYTPDGDFVDGWETSYDLFADDVLEVPLSANPDLRREDSERRLVEGWAPKAAQELAGLLAKA